MLSLYLLHIVLGNRRDNHLPHLPVLAQLRLYEDVVPGHHHYVSVYTS